MKAAETSPSPSRLSPRHLAPFRGRGGLRSKPERGASFLCNRPQFKAKVAEWPGPASADDRSDIALLFLTRSQRRGAEHAHLLLPGLRIGVVILAVGALRPAVANQP